MKKLILLLCLLSGYANAQSMFKDATTGKIMFSDTVGSEFLANKIYSKAKLFLLSTPYINDRVLLFADSSLKQITITGKNSIKPDGNLAFEYVNLNYIVDFKCKDNKYLTTITFTTIDYKSSQAISYIGSTYNTGYSSNNVEEGKEYKKIKRGELINYDSNSKIATIALNILNGVKSTMNSIDW
jgi:hypothetical protein